MGDDRMKECKKSSYVFRQEQQTSNGNGERRLVAVEADHAVRRGSSSLALALVALAGGSRRGGGSRRRRVGSSGGRVSGERLGSGRNWRVIRISAPDPDQESDDEYLR